MPHTFMGIGIDKLNNWDITPEERRLYRSIVRQAVKIRLGPILVGMEKDAGTELLVIKVILTF